MADPQVNPAARSTVFKLDLMQPVSIFVAQEFGIQPKDVIYVTNAPLYEYNKILIRSLQDRYSGPRNDGFSYDHVLLMEMTWPEAGLEDWMARNKTIYPGSFRSHGGRARGRLALWLMPIRQTSSAQDADRANGPLMSRGNTDSPAGTVVIAGDVATGGGVLNELRVTDGQKVKKDDIVAVLSNYSRADVTVRTSEAELIKARRQLEAMNSGYRVAEISVQEAVVKTTALNTQLKTLEVARSGKTRR